MISQERIQLLESRRLQKIENEYKAGRLSTEDFELQQLLIHLGTILQRERVKRGLFLKDVAELCRLDKSYISRIENGKLNIQLRSLVRYANALGFELTLMESR